MGIDLNEGMFHIIDVRDDLLKIGIELFNVLGSSCKLSLCQLYKCAKVRLCHILPCEPVMDLLIVGIDDIRTLDDQSLQLIEIDTVILFIFSTGAASCSILALHDHSPGTTGFKGIQSPIELFYRLIQIALDLSELPVGSRLSDIRES
jgi:hypothetical protein